MSAAVCMQRHYQSPKAWSVRFDAGAVGTYLAEWNEPTARHIRGTSNVDEATRDGAYCLALASADAHLALVALGRSEGRTGADFYLVPFGAEVGPDPHLDFERADLVRLEVSGINDDNDVSMAARVRQKIKQAQDAPSPVPAIAGVVGFRTARVSFRTAKS